MTNIIELLRKIGVNTIDSDYRVYIQMWNDWYKGKVDSFHNFSVYNGIQRIGVERASLTMAKTVAEDWANLLLNERVKISCENDAAQETLDYVLSGEHFQVEGNKTIELAFATGTGAFTEYLGADGLPHIDYHDARSIHPLKWKGRTITECAFSSIDIQNGRKCIYLRLYTWVNGQMHIANRWFDYDSGNAVACPEGVESDIDTGVTVSLFQIVTPNICNNIDTTIPMGVSVFANAIDNLKAVDIAFDSFRSEYALGRKRLLVPMSMIKLEQVREGEKAPIFDSNDLVYTVYEAGDDQNEFKDLSPEIRATEHIEGIRAELNLLSLKCGLGNNRYEFEKTGGVKTATEVISEQSDLYQSICKHELILRDALVSLARALLVLSGYGADEEITITFDDSIINDKNSIRAEARDEVAQGLMSKYRYLTEIKGMGEDEALEELKRIGQEQRITSGVIDFFDEESGEA